MLPHHLYACYQLANLLSLLIESAFQKYHKSIEQTAQNFQFVRDNFYFVNCKKHPITEAYQLHYVDKVRLKETFLYPPLFL